MSDSKFIIIEPSYLIRKGLSSLIEKIPETKVIHQFESKDEVDSLNNFSCDFIIINSQLITKDLIKLLDQKTDKASLVIIEKDEKKYSNIKAIEKININDTQKAILKKLNDIIGNKDLIEKKDNTPDEISKREADILKNIALGYSNKEIAEKLFISAHTVITHRKNITRKLGIKTVPGLTVYAILNKLIDINDTE